MIRVRRSRRYPAFENVAGLGCTKHSNLLVCVGLSPVVYGAERGIDCRVTLHFAIYIALGHTLMSRAIFIASLVGIFGSFASIALGYTDYGLVSINLKDALEPVWKWPILTILIMLTSLSVSIPFVAYFFRATGDPAMRVAAYGAVYLWLPFFMFYPGTRALGVVSDGAAIYTWLGVCVAQYLAAKIVLKAIGAKVAVDAA